MSVQYHMIISNGDQQLKVSRNGACFGSLATGASEHRHIFQVHPFPEDGGGRIFDVPAWAQESILRCQFEEVVYEIYESLSRSINPNGNELRVLGQNYYPIPIVKVRIRNFLSDLLEIRDQIPWLRPVTVDMKRMWVRVDTNYPADQVFQCLSSIRNIISYYYAGYCELRNQGFSKKASFILGQSFRLTRGLSGEHIWRPVSVGDYMLVNHEYMRPVDVLRLYNGEVVFKQSVFKGSRGYCKPGDPHRDDGARFNPQVINELSNHYQISDEEARSNWTTFLSTQNPEEGFIMSEMLRGRYQDREFISTEDSLNIMNQWVQIINRG